MNFQLKTLKDFCRRFIYSDEVNPLPMTILSTLFFVTLFDAMVLFSGYSYFPHLVRWFGMLEIKTGKNAGILAASLYVTRIISSYVWGYISDTRGKKYSLIFALNGLAISTLLFGISTTFYVAIGCRALQGVFMGILVISKSILVDYLDGTNHVLGLTILFNAYTLGAMIGPAIGGYLAFPAEQYKNIFSIFGVFGKFPILLPNAFLSSGIVVSILLVICNIPRFKKEEFLETNYYDYHQNINSCKPNAFKSSSLFKLLSFQGYFTAIVLYGLYALLTTGYMELFPIFAATSTKYNGLQMTLSEIGVLHIGPQLAATVLNFFLVPRFVKCLGGKNAFCIASMIFVTMALTTPPMYRVTNKAMRWFLLITARVFLSFAFATGFVPINVAINNSVSPNFLGMANGLGMSFASIGRTTGPMIFGSIFSWSLKNIITVSGQENSLGFPFNQYFVFFIIMLFGSFIMIYAYYFLPVNLNNKRNQGNLEE